MNKKIIIALIVLAVVIILIVLYKKGKLIMIRPKRLLKYFLLEEFDTGVTTSEMGNVPTYVNSKGKTRATHSGEKNMDKQTLNMLDSARDILEKDWNKLNPSKRIIFNINSGFRTPQFNDTLIGSAKNSAHILGKAVDISWGGYSKDQKEAILKALWEVGFRRFGTANSFVHVDSADSETGHSTPADWGYPSQLYSLAQIEAL